MKMSENWLREWVDPAIDSADLQHQLTLLGLEVDDAQRMPTLTNIVVARIESAEQHPNADKLRVCAVDDGSGEALSIVCGAPNARAGLVVPLARIGAELPGGMKIKSAKLRGVASRGMLCSARELALADDASGLMELSADAPVGMPISQYLQLDDTLISIELTPNRGDCLSIRGIARDIAARNRMPVKPPAMEAVAATTEDTFTVELQAGAGCWRYTGRAIKGIDPMAQTPLWMTEKLRRSGLRAISPVVDITNFVMLELGQPMHGFDLDKLSDKITVRNATDKEPIRLLDGRDLQLDEDTLVIADGSGAIGIAGIMGGDTTSVSDNTRNVFFEAAMFDPKKIAGRPRRYNAHTDSAHRFERTVDPLLQVTALHRATRLLIDICGGEAGPVIDITDPANTYASTVLSLSRQRVQQLLGVALPDSTIAEILSYLGLTLTEQAEGWQVEVPSYRPDISIEEDLIEEIARVHGYDNIPRTYPGLLPLMQPREETTVDLMSLKSSLVERGYQEAVTYSFVDEALQRQINPESDMLALANPISMDMAMMRTSLWPGLLSALQRNLNHQQYDVKLFETGLVFLPGDAGLLQQGVFAGLASGQCQRQHWDSPSHEVDFFDVKGDIDALFSMADATDIRYEKASHPALHPGQTARLLSDGEPVGWIGRLHPVIQQSLSLPQSAILFEVDQAALMGRKLINFKEFSKYPSIRRDIAIVIDEDVTLNSVLACIYNNSPKYLENVVIFDVYTGKGVIPGRKSLALSLILQELSRTLTDVEVEKTVSGILAALVKDLGATLRE